MSHSSPSRDWLVPQLASKRRRLAYSHLDHWIRICSVGVEASSQSVRPSDAVAEFECLVAVDNATEEQHFSARCALLTYVVRVRGAIGADAQAYASSILAEVEAHAEVEGREAFLEEAFTDLVLDDLEEQGFWPDYQLAYLSQRGAGLSAWGYDPASRTLYLCITDFVHSTQATTMPKAELAAIANRLKGFYRKARNGTLGIQEHSSVLDVADTIRLGVDFDSVRAYVLTNRLSSAEITHDDYDGVAAVVRSWDLETIRRSRTTGASPEPIVVDFVETFGAGLPCLIAPQEHPDVQILLAFIPGTHLAQIYDEYGPRLLEQNVRSFLMVRGKINMGIRDTLRSAPERFLAYNNGLTATASAVEVKPDADGLPSLVLAEDLQIVNGGQTTASIAFAGRDRDSDVDLASVFVQMKLAVVKPELLEDIVPWISRYANRQNVVQESDLSANNEDLRELERLSRAEWTPSDNTGRPSKWYFERARGSYAIDKIRAGTPSAQKKFTLENPTNQRFGKNELALYMNTWAKRPHVVCRGGQKNFAEFIVSIDEAFHGTNEEATVAQEVTDEELRSRNRQTYRDLIAKAILFKQADHLINVALGGTYKRAVVAYTLAYLLEHTPAPPDLASIWRHQEVDASVATAIVEIAEPLKDFLIDSAGGRNITEWAKSESCWTAIRKQTFPFTVAVPTSGSARAEWEPEATDLDTSLSRRTASTAAEALDTLAACIGRVHGEAIEGTWRRYRRKKWFHVGDSGAPTPSGLGTLDIYGADLSDGEGGQYPLLVAVDFPSRLITPLDQLPTPTKAEVEQWLASR